MALLMRASLQAPPHQLTKMGGIPLANPKTPWFRCSSCDGYLHFVGQVDLEETKIPGICERQQLLLIFFCDHDPGMCDAHDPYAGGNAALLVSKQNLIPFEPPCDPEDFLLDETLFDLEECDDSSDAYNRAFNEDRVVCGKVGGEPFWTDYDRTPVCRCGNKMTFVVQIEHTGEFEFYRSTCAFVCSTCLDQAKFLMT